MHGLVIPPIVVDYCDYPKVVRRYLGEPSLTFRRRLVATHATHAAGPLHSP